MASVMLVNLQPATAMTSSPVNSNASSLELGSSDFIAWLHVSANDGSTTVDAEIQHSADGTNWKTLAAFTNIANTTGSEAVAVTIPVLPYVRSNVVLTGTPSATVKVQLWHDKTK